jgi:predicted nucleic acid-binding protein
LVAYLDSSVALRHILKGEDKIRLALECGKVFSSELFEIECRRVIHRCRMEGELDDERLVLALERLGSLLDGINMISLSTAIKKRAMESFPVVVKTLDALHLASAIKLGEALHGEIVVMYSHDKAMNQCAKALGLGLPEESL